MESLEGLPVSQWPKLQFAWSWRWENLHHSRDGLDSARFWKFYRDGFVVGIATLEDINSRLSARKRGLSGDVWKDRDPEKLEKLIAHLAEGKPVSPPFCLAISDGISLDFLDGHHRYAVAREAGEKEIPLLFETCFQERASKILPINWVGKVCRPTRHSSGLPSAAA